MDATFHLDFRPGAARDSRCSPADGASRPAVPALDWHGLAARFAASRACLVALAPAGPVLPPRTGSFDAAIARRLRAYRGSAVVALGCLPQGNGERGVNRVVSADRKAPSDMVVTDTGLILPGDRGLK